MAQAPSVPITITIGDEVELTDGLKGEVKFIGELQGKQGIFYGIELQDNKGTNDGSIDNHYYFKTKDKKGKFVQIGSIKSTKPSDQLRVTVGDKVRILGKEDATIRYIGTPLFKPGIWYGVEFEKPDGKNNGTVNNHQYFQCKDKYGSFVQAQSIQILQEQKPQSASNKTTSANDIATTSSSSTKNDNITSASTSTTSTASSTTTDKVKKPKTDEKYQVADKVVVKTDRRGQIKWIGEAKNFGVGTWYGIRLVEQKGQCNGSYKDHKFFQCPDGYGIYVQKILIVKKLDDNDPQADFDFMNEEKKYDKEKEESFQQLKDEKDKLRLIRQKFQDTDTDGNKTVDIGEWLKLTKEIFPKMNEQESKLLFRQIDVSDSKEISFAEFDAWIVKIGGIDKINPDAENKEDVSTDEQSNEKTNDKTKANKKEDKIVPDNASLKKNSKTNQKNQENDKEPPK